jgi:hypothetical protein
VTNRGYSDVAKLVAGLEGARARSQPCNELERQREGSVMPSDVITTFWPRRWRVFVWMFAIGVPVWAGAFAIVYAVDPWSGWWGGQLASACASLAAMVGVTTWRAPDTYAISVSDTEILGWPDLRNSRTIPLAELDRARSARRSPLDRILGRQRLYSTSGARIYLWRAVFAGSDLRQLLALLRLEQS